MREDPVLGPGSGMHGLDDNVVPLPNLVSGDLADVLAAAGAPGEDSELRGELAARTAFRSAIDDWPSRRRRLLRGRTPAVVVVSTMASVLLATTGLAAASVLPGSADRAVDGILGSVGVNITPPASPTAPVPAATNSGSAAQPLERAAVPSHVRCTAAGTGSGTTATRGVQTSACVVSTHAAHTGQGARPVQAAVAQSPVTTAPAPSTATVKPPKARHTNSGSGDSGHAPSSPPTTIPGGGTNRGGNQGVGGGCGRGTSTTITTTTTTTTTTTVPATEPSSSSDPTTTTTTTATGGCAHGGHHHGAAGGTTSTSDPAAPTT